MNDRARFEVMPFARGEEEAAELPEPVRLTVTCSPKHRLDDTRRGRHSAARARARRDPAPSRTDGARPQSIWTTCWQRMAGAGIDDALLIGGDATPPHGPYSSAVELLPLIDEHARRPQAIGIGGYPEGHPLIDAETLAEALEEKSRSPTTSRRSSASTPTPCSRGWGDP